MIHLTRLNHEPLIVNSDLIEFIESAPDTVITMISGEKVVVLEKAEQVVQLVLEFRRALLAGTPRTGATGSLPVLAGSEAAGRTGDEESASG
jgi:flagellar protein FlbD